MEEKKLKKVTKKEEPTVEQLKNYCDQLLTQRNQLAQKLEQTNSVLTKLPILFEIIKLKEAFPEEFVKICANEVMATLLPPKEESKEEKKDGDENPKK